jgi:hypothetical protein
MKDVDIYGFATDGRRIFGQVTYSEFERASPKFSRLCGHGQEGHHVFFCKARHQEVLDGVTVVPIEDVFGEFTETETGKQWLSFGRSQAMTASARHSYESGRTYGRVTV